MRIAGVAAISIPALLCAWLLKNVSRVFVQNLSFADDATYRHGLTVTYLRLAANPNLQLDAGDRTLTLNPLFRPGPNQTGEEGPPTGLVDLIKNKQS
jgi:hypothetical protein